MEGNLFLTTAAARKTISKSPDDPGRRERNKREKKARIVRAAHELFHSQGFAETTTSQIAEAADIGAGTLFLYARSKEDLLIMVFKDEMIASSQKYFARLTANASAIDQMMTVFENMFDYHARDMELSRVLLKELVMPSSPERTDDIDELMDVIFDGLGNIAQRAGSVANADPELTARSAFAIYYYALISWVGGAVERADCLGLLRRQLSALLDTGE